MAKAISLSQINYAGRIYIKIKVKVETIFPRHELRHSSSAKLSKTTEATAEKTSSNSKVFGKQKVSEISATAGHWLIARESLRSGQQGVIYLKVFIQRRKIMQTQTSE